MAARTGNYYAAKFLLKYNANINAQTDLGNTPLISVLIGSGPSLVLIGLLLTPDVGLSLTNKQGKTVLDFARKTGNRNIIELIEKKARTQKK